MDNSKRNGTTATKDKQRRPTEKWTTEHPKTRRTSTRKESKRMKVREQEVGALDLENWRKRGEERETREVKDSGVSHFLASQH